MLELTIAADVMLWNKDLAMRALDKMMRAYIRHDLRSWENLRVELIFELSPLLEGVSREETRV
jgi:hypothetical protein